MRRRLSKFFRGFIENPIIGFLSILSGLISLIQFLAAVCNNYFHWNIHVLEIWKAVTNEYIVNGICIVFIIGLFIKCMLSMNAARYRLTNYPIYIKDLIRQTEIITNQLEDNKIYNGNLEFAIKETCEFSIGQLDNLCAIMTQITGAKMSACIKVQLDEEDNQLIDFARSSRTGRKRQNKKPYNGGDTIDNNTDFFSITYGLLEDNVFYQCDLRDFANQCSDNGYRYENSTVDWVKKYKGTAIVPICDVYSGDGKIYGFLCIDTTSGTAFRKKYKASVTNFLDIYADNLSRVVQALIVYINRQSQRP